MARMHYRDPGTGNWVPVGTVGPVGPSAVSADANNTAVLGTDSLIFVPAPTPPVLDHGGLTGLADDDHPHYYNQTRGDARYALTGHTHGATILPADVAPPAIAAAAAVGVSVDYAREDHTHQGVQLASGAPPALTPDIAGAVGAGTTAARDNHVHNVPAAAPITNLTATTTNAEGSGASFARNDHTHAIDTAAPVALGAANAVGTATSLARSDHVHIYPTAANVGAATSGDVTTAISSHTSGASHVALTANLPVALGAAAAGNGTTSARDNHVHPTTGLSLTGHTHSELEIPATMATEAEVSSAITTHSSGQPHVALSSVLPTALTPDIAGSFGAGSTSARTDHAHNVAAAAPTTNLTASTTNSEGTGSSFARNDHSHAITANVAASPLGAAGAVGTNAALARADHVHIYPSAANVGADAAGTASSAVATHAGDADPHTGYQKESEKGAINGYAALGADGLVPLTQLPEISSGDEVLIQDTAPASQVGLDLWVDSDDPGVTGSASVTYVDDQNALQDTAITGKVSKAGDTITGPVIINGSLAVAGDVTVSTAVTEQHGITATPLTAFKVVATLVDIRGADPIHLGLASNNAAVRVENVASPTNANDVANKSYVDGKIVAAAARPSNTAGVTPAMIWIPTT